MISFFSKITKLIRFSLILLFSICSHIRANLENVPDLTDPFPTQILSAYNNGRSQAGRWPAGARMNDNEEVDRHFQRYIRTTTQNYNIGVIQVKLSNWTDHPAFKPPISTPSPNPDISNPRRRQSRLRMRQNDKDGWRPIDDDKEKSDENSSTYIFQTGNPRDKSRYAHVDNTYAYILMAVFLGLILFLMTLYLFISCRSFCRKRERRRHSGQPVMTFPTPYAYYESNQWGTSQRGGDLERLFRSDLETKRPPLIAPPPPPPRVPPPPIPHHLRPPTYTRRKFVPPPPNRDSPVEREIRLQMLKRQISESTLSTRTRTNSF